VTTPPVFDAAFRAKLTELMVWRRDVRRFIPHKPVSPDLVAELLETAALAPSVGNSQPWRFVLVEDADRRAKVIANFQRANKDALADYSGEKARLYAGLKLAGLKEAPVHLAVFADEGTGQGHGLGRRTMPEMLDYSAVMAV
jgi:5,6-dimethylbenzimidazole synthase